MSQSKSFLFIVLFIINYYTKTNGQCTYVDLYGVVLPTDECAFTSYGQDWSTSINFVCLSDGIILENVYPNSDCLGEPQYVFNATHDQSNCVGSPTDCSLITYISDCSYDDSSASDMYAEIKIVADMCSNAGVKVTCDDNTGHVELYNDSSCNGDYIDTTSTSDACDITWKCDGSNAYHMSTAKHVIIIILIIVIATVFVIAIIAILYFVHRKHQQNSKSIKNLNESLKEKINQNETDDHDEPHVQQIVDKIEEDDNYEAAEIDDKIITHGNGVPDGDNDIIHAEKMSINANVFHPPTI